MRLKSIISILFIILIIGIGIFSWSRIASKAPEIDLTNIESPIVLESDPRLGSEEPKVIIVHFGDFECEYCKDAQKTLIELAQEFPEDILFAWKDFPNTSLHPESVSAAVAARCAHDQDAFWEYQKFLFANQDQLNKEFYTALAVDLELNEKKFEKCIEKQTPLEEIQASFEQGHALEITAIPTIFIGADRYTGKMTSYELRDLVLDALGL